MGLIKLMTNQNNYGFPFTNLLILLAKRPGALVIELSTLFPQPSVMLSLYLKNFF